MHYMYCRTNGNYIDAVRMFRALFPDRRMPDHRIFQQLHRHFRETRSFHVTRHDAGQRRSVPSPSLEESTLIVVADKQKYKCCCSLRKCYLLRLPVGGTEMYVVAGSQSSRAEQLC
ncbi:hypothetical protein TNCV_283741 [Trichonephila clavipes]|uniref:DUF4817 domain-containing protein n=1 Tax=Trichonephila clavipes TaxID=2585209 RepID=A0A8X6SHH1_TRICX|nr:hypothetical protein TNCV_283741 [Trichonephila clavipes]